VIQAGGRRNDVNTDVANDIGTPEWRVPVGIPDAMSQAAQQVVGAVDEPCAVCGTACCAFCLPAAGLNAGTHHLAVQPATWRLGCRPARATRVYRCRWPRRC